jgi:small subunit ribosomal protein S4
MARYRGPRLRIIRRLGELPGLTQKHCSRSFPPGQHGPKKAKLKESQYAIRLKEKQKLRFNYGVSESQLLRYMREARRKKGSTGEILLQLLEMRLDNIIFRLGFAPTIVAARQLISHGHICVNSKSLNIPSYRCRINDSISIHPDSKAFVKHLCENFSPSPVPSHLESNRQQLEGKVKSFVNRESVIISVNELLIVEYYSRKV